MIGLLGLGASAISSGAKGLLGGLFGRNREERQAKRAQRKQKRQARRAARRGGAPTPTRKSVPVGEAAATLAATRGYEPGAPGAKKFDTEKIMAWLKENWYIPVGIVALIVIFTQLKKKKVGRRMARVRSYRSNPGNPGRRSKSRSSGKTGRQKAFSTRARNVAREWKRYREAGGRKISRKTAWSRWG